MRLLDGNATVGLKVEMLEELKRQRYHGRLRWDDEQRDRRGE